MPLLSLSNKAFPPVENAWMCLGKKIKNEREDPHGSAFLFPQHKVRNEEKKKKRIRKWKRKALRIECFLYKLCKSSFI